VLLEGMATTLEARGTCQPKRKLPWKVIPKSRRPFEARNVSMAGIVACPTRHTWLPKIQVSLAASPVLATYLW